MKLGTLMLLKVVALCFHVRGAGRNRGELLRVELSAIWLADADISEAVCPLVTTAGGGEDSSVVSTRESLRGPERLDDSKWIGWFLRCDAQIGICGHDVVVILPLVLPDLLRVLQKRNGHRVPSVALSQEVHLSVDGSIL